MFYKSGLLANLSNNLHGQHLVKRVVFRSVKGHITDPDPSSALALSFHGPSGVGKNYVTRMITESLFVRGMNSRFVHLKLGTRHFPHADKLREYQVYCS